MTAYLLDVNLLLALVDPMHVHHEDAHHWFASTGRLSWATCPHTENGFVRVASHPRYPNRPGHALAAVAILREFCSLQGHIFWEETVSIRDSLMPGAVIGHNHVTDVHLLSLAVRNGGKLATLDRRIPVSAVRNGADALEQVLPG